MEIAYDQALLTPIEAAARAARDEGTSEPAFASVTTNSFGALLKAAGTSS